MRRDGYLGAGEGRKELRRLRCARSDARPECFSQARITASHAFQKLEHRVRLPWCLPTSLPGFAKHVMSCVVVSEVRPFLLSPPASPPASSAILHLRVSWHWLLYALDPQDVLYPSEDIEVQLSLLSVYPTPECLAETDDEAEESDMDTETETNGLGGAGEGAAQGELSLQRKTDEVLKSITSSFAAVTDMFAPKDDDSSSSLSPRRPTVRGGRGSAQEQDDAAGKGGKAATTFNRTGWDLFKGQSMTEIKRRFEGAGLSVSPARNTQSNNAINTGSSSTSTTPTGGGFGMFGDSFRDFRRRSHEAVTEAVTKLKSALDEGDDVGPTWTDKKSTRNTSGALTATESDRIRAAARAGRAASAPSTEDDSFWRPFGDVTRADETPVPLPDTLGGGGLSLPSALKSSRLKTNSLSPSAQKSASDRLKAYYGAASP